MNEITIMPAQDGGFTVWAEPRLRDGPFARTLLYAGVLDDCLKYVGERLRQPRVADDDVRKASWPMAETPNPPTITPALALLKRQAWARKRAGRGKR